MLLPQSKFLFITHIYVRTLFHFIIIHLRKSSCGIIITDSLGRTQAIRTQEGLHDAQRSGLYEGAEI